MKTFQFFILVLFLSAVSSTSAKAQIIDSFPWFKLEPKLGDMRVIDWNSTFSIEPQFRSSIQSISAAAPTIKKLPSPIVLKAPNGYCYQIGCQPSAECRSCTLYWKDINNDGKIQPRRELRCVCSSAKEQCQLRARRVECK